MSLRRVKRFSLLSVNKAPYEAESFCSAVENPAKGSYVTKPQPAVKGQTPAPQTGGMCLVSICRSLVKESKCSTAICPILHKGS